MEALILSGFNSPILHGGWWRMPAMRSIMEKFDQGLPFRLLQGGVGLLDAVGLEIVL
jgi:hypothetical protein